jgi:hypothetical protein
MATEQELKIIEDNKEIIKKRIDDKRSVAEKLAIIEAYKPIVNKSAYKIVRNTLLQFLEEQKKVITSQDKSTDVLRRNLGFNIGDNPSAIDEQPKPTETTSVQPAQKAQTAKAETAQDAADRAALDRIYKTIAINEAILTGVKEDLDDNPNHTKKQELAIKAGAAKSALKEATDEKNRLYKTMQNTELAVRELDKEIAKVGKSVGEILAVNNNRIRSAELNKAIENINGLIKTAKDSKNRDSKADVVFNLQSEYGKLKGQYDVANKTYEEEKKDKKEEQKRLDRNIYDMLSMVGALFPARRRS